MGKRAESVLGEMLFEKGLTVRDVYEYCRSRGFKVSYGCIGKYIRCCDKDYGRKYVWKLIDEVVEKCHVLWYGAPYATDIQRTMIAAAHEMSRRDWEEVRWRSIVSLGISDYRAKNLKNPRKIKRPRSKW